jgi:hypothetical protein
LEESDGIEAEELEHATVVWGTLVSARCSSGCSSGRCKVLIHSSEVLLRLMRGARMGDLERKLLTRNRVA